MREKYWKLLQKAIYNYIYWKDYRRRIAIVSTAVNVFSALLSCASVAAWAIWQKHPAIWAFLVGISQIVQVVYPLLPFQKRLTALDYLIPKTDQLVRRITDTWHKLEHGRNVTGIDYMYESSKYNNMLSSLEIEFLGADNIPDRKYIRNYIDDEYSKYLSSI